MEKLEVLNEKGEKTGEVKIRSEIHAAGNWHLAVHCWIINPNGELLIQKRAATKESSPNQWDISAAGHVLANHQPILSAIREIEEELSIRLEKEDFKKIFTAKQKRISKNGAYINNEINPVYLVEKDIDLSRVKLQEEEVTEIKWIPWQELEKKILANDPTFVSHPEEYRKLFKYLSN